METYKLLIIISLVIGAFTIGEIVGSSVQMSGDLDQISIALEKASISDNHLLYQNGQYYNITHVEVRYGRIINETI